MKEGRSVDTKWLPAGKEGRSRGGVSPPRVRGLFSSLVVYKRSCRRAKHGFEQSGANLKIVKKHPCRGALRAPLRC